MSNLKTNDTRTNGRGHFLNSPCSQFLQYVMLIPPDAVIFRPFSQNQTTDNIPNLWQFNNKNLYIQRLYIFLPFSSYLTSEPKCSNKCSPNCRAVFRTAHAVFRTTIHDRWDHSELSSPVRAAACDTIATGMLPLYRIACSPQIPDRNCKTPTPPSPVLPLFLAALMR